MTDPSHATVLAFLRPGAVADSVLRAMEEEGLTVQVRRPEKGDEHWQEARSASALLVGEAVEPQALQRARKEGWIPAAAPVFVVARKLPSRDRYIDWLKAGAWSIVRIPLESTGLALQLRNTLRGQPSEHLHLHRRYPIGTLEQVAAETFSLAHRYDRPLHCVAIRQDGEHDGATGETHALRLAEEAEMLVRTSDLVGIAGRSTVLVLLPDTDSAGATRFLDRLTDALEERLEDWETPATVASASIEEVESGRELMDLARHRLDATPP